MKKENVEIHLDRAPTGVEKAKYNLYGCPNSDFCFDEKDFINTVQKMNDVTWYQDVHCEVRKKINQLISKESPVKSEKIRFFEEPLDSN